MNLSLLRFLGCLTFLLTSLASLAQNGSTLGTTRSYIQYVSCNDNIIGSLKWVLIDKNGIPTYRFTNQSQHVLHYSTVVQSEGNASLQNPESDELKPGQSFDLQQHLLQNTQGKDPNRVIRVVVVKADHVWGYNQQKDDDCAMLFYEAEYRQAQDVCSLIGGDPTCSDQFKASLDRHKRNYARQQGAERDAASQAQANQQQVADRQREQANAASQQTAQQILDRAESKDAIGQAVAQQSVQNANRLQDPKERQQYLETVNRIDQQTQAQAAKDQQQMNQVLETVKPVTGLLNDGVMGMYFNLSNKSSDSNYKKGLDHFQKQEYKEALSKFQKAYKQNYRVSGVQIAGLIAFMFHNGLGTNQDDNEAKKVCEQCFGNSALGSYVLGEIADKEKDENNTTYYLFAGLNDIPHGYYMAGQTLERKGGTLADKEKGGLYPNTFLECYRRGAKAGDKDCQEALKRLGQSG